MNHYVQTYGKQLIKELMDNMLINNGISDEKARELLIKHNLISKRTKIINASFYKNAIRVRKSFGVYETTGEMSYSLNIKNGRGQSVLYFAFNDSEVSNILEDINNETDRSDE